MLCISGDAAQTPAAVPSPTARNAVSIAGFHGRSHRHDALAARSSLASAYPAEPEAAFVSDGADVLEGHSGRDRAAYVERLRTIFRSMQLLIRPVHTTEIALGRACHEFEHHTVGASKCRRVEVFIGRYAGMLVRRCADAPMRRCVDVDASECRSVGVSRVSECRSVGVSECRSVGVSECHCQHAGC